MDVLIVDDHPIIHQTLAAVVRKAIPGATIHAASDLDAALARARSIPKLGLTLLDLGLPGCSGIESLQRFQRAMPKARVVVISANEDPATVQAALAAGAAGYLPKTVPPNTMVSAMRHVASGGTYAPAPALSAADPRDASPLTARQTEILGLIVTGCSNREIAERLKLTEGTVKQHTHAIYQALGVSSRTEALVAAAKLGIKL